MLRQVLLQVNNIFIILTTLTAFDSSCCSGPKLEYTNYTDTVLDSSCGCGHKLEHSNEIDIVFDSS